MKAMYDHQPEGDIVEVKEDDSCSHIIDILVHQSLLIITLKKGSGKTVILNLLPYVGLVHFQGSGDTLKI